MGQRTRRILLLVGGVGVGVVVLIGIALTSGIIVQRQGSPVLDYRSDAQQSNNTVMLQATSAPIAPASAAGRFAAQNAPADSGSTDVLKEAPSAPPNTTGHQVRNGRRCTWKTALVCGRHLPMMLNSNVRMKGAVIQHRNGTSVRGRTA